MTAPRALDLGEFVAASPSSFHAAAEAARRLASAGFEALDEAEDWTSRLGPGHRGYAVRDGAIIAWVIPQGAGPATPYSVIGAHTDSPAFKLKPSPTLRAHGWVQAGVEVYGGPLLNSWLDRELTLAGRLVLTGGEQVLTRVEKIARIPQLAIHLDREVNAGLALDKQRHTQPVLALASGPHTDVLALLAEAAGVDREEVAGYDIVTCDAQAPALFGAHEEFLASARLDNLSSVHAGVTALAGLEPGEAAGIGVLAAFDHEEVGSATRSGAGGPFLEDVTARISHALGADDAQRRRALSQSFCLSADAGHAVHPNYPERHDPANLPIAGGGPLLKINANQRYATDAVGAGRWHRAATAAGVPVQEFVSRNTVPCGSTIGPITATRLGMVTVDVGLALLSMHSAREMCAVADVAHLGDALAAFYRTE